MTKQPAATDKPPTMSLEEVREAQNKLTNLEVAHSRAKRRARELGKRVTEAAGELRDLILGAGQARLPFPKDPEPEEPPAEDGAGESAAPSDGEPELLPSGKRAPRRRSVPA